jgi:hypothetical protein
MVPITTVKTSRLQAREAGQLCRQAQAENRRFVINNDDVAVVEQLRGKSRNRSFSQ